MSYSWFCTLRWTNFSWNIQNIYGHKSETMWCMRLNIGMGDEHQGYYKHTKFGQIRGVTLRFFGDLTWNDPFVKL